MNQPHHRGASAYRTVGVQTQANTQDQYQLVLLMLEATIESLNVARGAIVQGDVATKIAKIDKAIRIVQEGLRTSLDIDNGGELAANLANLYDYAVMRMTQGNAANDANALTEVIQLLKPIAEAWREMRSASQNEPAAAAEAAPAPVKTAAAAPEAKARNTRQYPTVSVAAHRGIAFA